MGEIYAQTAQKYGARLDAARVNVAFRAAFKNHSGERLSHPASESGERLFWRRVVWDTLAQAGAVRDFDAYLHELYDVMALPENWRLYPDALPILEKLLRRGVPMALVSNWDRRLLRTMEGLGLYRYFRAVLVSSVEGLSKPDPRLFRMAARRLGLHPAQCLHVGDSVRDDVQGALASGVGAVLIDRSSLFPSPGVRTLRNLLELGPMVVHGPRA